MDRQLEQVFLRFSVDKLDQFTRRIDDCLERLSYEQIWSRGSDNENAVGNLVLHLCGNVRQWIGAGVAGRADTRVRDREFQERGDIQAVDLRARLEASIAEAVDVIRGVRPERLTETIEMQGYRLTVLEAIYHVVEHFAQHTGQILYATKLMTHDDLGYYNHLKHATSHGEQTP